MYNTFQYDGWTLRRYVCIYNITIYVSPEYGARSAAAPRRTSGIVILSLSTEGGR